MKRLMLVPVIAIVCAAAVGVGADTVTTTSGQTFTGKIVEENEKQVVVETMSGRVPIPREAIASIEKEGEAERQSIKPITIDPVKAESAYEAAQKAFKEEQWIAAGSLFEGLLKLDSTVFPPEKRITATGALVTCYLQTGDTEGAAGNLRRRAHMVDSESDTKRLLAAAEALEASGGPAVDGQPVTTYTDAISAAMKWKAARIADEAKEKAAELPRMNRDLDALDAHLQETFEILAGAELYVPGYASKKRKDELVKAAADAVVETAEDAVETCTEEREDLSRFWNTSQYSVKIARQYNAVARRYLLRRAAAEDSLKALEDLAKKYEIDKLYDEGKVKNLIKQLDDLEYHLKRHGMKDRYKIQLRRIGG